MVSWLSRYRGTVGLSIVALLLAACSHAQYKYYGIEPLPGKSLEGTLLGPEPKNDLPLSKCDPKGECVVVFTVVWERALSDIIELKERLKACEEGD